MGHSHPAPRPDPMKEFNMTDQHQKDLDNAVSDRNEVQAEAARERMKSEEKSAKAEDKATQTFAKDIDKAEAKAMNRDPITGSPGSHPIGMRADQ
jgi:hypothetical protein